MAQGDGSRSSEVEAGGLQGLRSSQRGSRAKANRLHVTHVTHVYTLDIYNQAKPNNSWTGFERLWERSEGAR